jgi:hypothetical protein
VLAAAAVLGGSAPAGADVLAVQGSAFGAAVGGALAILAPTPSATLGADRSTPAAQLGPVVQDGADVGIPGVLEAAALRAGAQGLADPNGLTGVTAFAEVTGLRILGAQAGAPALLQADAIRSRCTAGAGGPSGTVELIGTTLAATSVAPNTTVSVAGLLDVTLNEQLRTDTAGSTQLLVRGAHVRLLAPSPDRAGVVDVVLAQSVCSAERNGVVTPSTTRGVNTTSPVVPTTAVPNRGTVPPVVLPAVTTTTPGSPTTTTAAGAATAPTRSGGSAHTEPGRSDRGRGPERAAFVESVIPPSEVSLAPDLIAENVAIAAALVLLVAFPADLFNSTVLANYDEIAHWPVIAWTGGVRARMSTIPSGIGLPVFALVGALLYAQLSPDFGFNRHSLALLLGMLWALLLVSLVYDVSREAYVRRHEVPARLRTQALILPVAIVLVVLSRLAHFTPGYIYGLFTAVIYLRPVDTELDGRGLALASAMLGGLAIGGWFLWEPVRRLAEEPGAGLPTLTLDAFLATFWVCGVGAIVFGLAPLRFFYGEAVKAWSTVGWALIYGLGLVTFLQTIGHPDRGFYARGHVPLLTVLVPFVVFGLFSLAFWGYFRFRRQPPGPPAEPAEPANPADAAVPA